MKRQVLMIIAVLLFSLVSTIAASGYTSVSVGEAKTMVDSNPSLVVLDVRTPSEYYSGHIRNTMHIPLAELGGRLDELNETDSILVYCASGGRSATASQLLVDNGFLAIYNMLGGISAWISAGYPVYIKYSSIQEAINNASPRDTILVSSGTYYENLVVNKSISLIGENRQGTIIDGSGENKTVVEITASNVTISRLTAQNCSRNAGTSYAGIEISGSACNVTSNSVTETKMGIFLANSPKSRIAENVLKNNGQGIALYLSSEVVVEANDISANTVGISLAFSSGNIIVDNSVVNGSAGGHGMTLTSDSFNNTISSNKLESNYHGMWLSSSHNNSITENTVAHNELLSVELTDSSDNSFGHNNFLDTPNHLVTDPSSTGNIWDNGCEGNYWSNYNGTDLDNNGIGDTYLPWEGVDNYPLMNLYWSPGDIDHDLDVDIFDVVRCAIAYGSTPSDPHWNPHCDIAEPFGVINIFDLVTIAASYGEEYTP